MAYLRESDIRSRATRATHAVRKSARAILKEATASAGQKFDVFLSHSSSEPEDILLGIKETLQDAGLSVYVDRYNDPQLSPGEVTPKTAELLRERMRCSKALLYAYSVHSTRSRWMPWELGFFDGLGGRVGVLPVTQNGEEKFKGEEYLNLYPYVDQALTTDRSESVLWINESANRYARLASWIRGKSEIESH